MKISLLYILGALVLSSLGIKIYLTIDNYNYEKGIKEMGLTVQIESTIEHKTLEREGYEIHYYVSGKVDGDLVVFLHPAFADHRVFNQQIDFFSKNFRVITVDLIGHGLSKANKSKDRIDVSAEHINEIMIQEGYEEAHLVGVSAGSLIAQYFGFNYPKKTKSIVALGSYNINKDVKEIAVAQRNSNLKLIFRGIFSTKSFRKATAKITAKSEKAQALFYESSSHFERKSLPVMSGLATVIQDRELAEPQYSTLILVGEFDIELSLKMAKQWHGDLTNSKFEIIKDAGHCANMDKPEEFNKVVMDFITEDNI